MHCLNLLYCYNPLFVWLAQEFLLGTLTLVWLAGYCSLYGTICHVGEGVSRLLDSYYGS